MAISCPQMTDAVLERFIDFKICIIPQFWGLKQDTLNLNYLSSSRSIYYRTNEARERNSLSFWMIVPLW